MTAAAKRQWETGEIQAAQGIASACLVGLQHGCRMSWLSMAVPLGLIYVLLSKVKALRGETRWLDLLKKPADL